MHTVSKPTTTITCTIASLATALLLYGAWMMYDPTLDLAYIETGMERFAQDLFVAVFIALSCMTIVGFLYHCSLPEE